MDQVFAVTRWGMRNRYQAWLTILVAVGALLMLPSVASAKGPELSATQIQHAIDEEGLDWVATLYEREFAVGAILDEEPEPPKKQVPERPDREHQAQPQVLPSSIDWRAGDWVSPVKDQGNCGSCWAFAGVGAFEALWAIAANTPGQFLDLSEQILVSCASSNYGCSGGYMGVTARFLRDEGTYHESCFPYSASNSACSNACANWRSSAYRIQSYSHVNQSVSALKSALQHGPLQTALDIYRDFQYYGGGVYECVNASWNTLQGGHAVLLVGYQDTPGQYGGGYFIVKNSWGAGWGESGYFRIGYSQVTNKVDFGAASYRYTVEGDPGPDPTPDPTPNPQDPYEPDDTHAQASSISSGATQTRSIAPAGDIDWATFELLCTADVQLVTGGDADEDTVLGLYDADMTCIAEDDDGGPDRYSRIVHRLSPGTYYVKVRDYWPAGTILAYNLTLTTDCVPEPEPDPTPDPGDQPCDPPTPWIAEFARSHQRWSTQDRTPRFVADVTGDAIADVVGFSWKKVMVSVSTGDAFAPATRWHKGFCVRLKNWTQQPYTPRFLGDVNGDGKADVVAVNRWNVVVALSDGNRFGRARSWCKQFGLKRKGWARQDVTPRAVADVNGDGKADVIGFKRGGVVVALSNGCQFRQPTRWTQEYGRRGESWSLQEETPRVVADVNGDAMADIVGFAADGVYVALSTGRSFRQSSLWHPGFGANAGWTDQNRTPRMIGDMNGDGLGDVVAFGEDAVYVALSNGSGFGTPIAWIQAYATGANGWSNHTQHPRATADVNGDGKDDLIGFGPDATYVSLTR